MKITTFLLPIILLSSTTNTSPVKKDEVQKVLTPHEISSEQVPHTLGCISTWCSDEGCPAGWWGCSFRVCPIKGLTWICCQSVTQCPKIIHH